MWVIFGRRVVGGLFNSPFKVDTLFLKGQKHCSLNPNVFFCVFVNISQMPREPTRVNILKFNERVEKYIVRRRRGCN